MFITQQDASLYHFKAYKSIRFLCESCYFQQWLFFHWYWGLHLLWWLIILFIRAWGQWQCLMIFWYGCGIWTLQKVLLLQQFQNISLRVYTKHIWTSKRLHQMVKLGSMKNTITSHSSSEIKMKFLWLQ